MITAEVALNGSIATQRSYLNQLGVYYPHDVKDTTIRFLVRGSALRIYTKDLPTVLFSYESKLLSSKEIYASIVEQVGSFDAVFKATGIAYEEAKDAEYLIVFAAFHVQQCDAITFYLECVPKNSAMLIEDRDHKLLSALEGLDSGVAKISLHAAEKNSALAIKIKHRRALCDRYFKSLRLRERAQQLLDKVLDFNSPDKEAFLHTLDFDVKALIEFKNMLNN